MIFAAVWRNSALLYAKLIRLSIGECEMVGGGTKKQNTLHSNFSHYPKWASSPLPEVLALGSNLLFHDIPLCYNPQQGHRSSFVT